MRSNVRALPDPAGATTPARPTRVKMLTPEEVAEALAISRSSVRRMIINKTLPAILLISGKQKKSWRVPEAELERWVNRKLRQAAEQGKTDAQG